jgi:hypothetical protein
MFGPSCLDPFDRVTRRLIKQLGRTFAFRMEVLSSALHGLRGKRIGIQPTHNNDGCFCSAARNPSKRI